VFENVAPSFSGLANWCVVLTGAVSAVAVSDGSGNYTFTGLPIGSYTVCEQIQTNWHQTFPPSPQGGASCPNGFGYAFTLSAGGGAMFIDFGNVTP